MIIVWRGYGFLVPLFALLCVFAAAAFPQHENLAGGLALIASAAVLWPLGRKFNRDAKLHTLFWIPMQYWAVVLGISGPLVIFGKR